jgi:hypothetical protein
VAVRIALKQIFGEKKSSPKEKEIETIKIREEHSYLEP